MTPTGRAATPAGSDEVARAPELDAALRSRLAQFADLLIAGGAGMPPASEADVQGKWIDRALGARPDIVDTVHAVLATPGEPAEELARLRADDKPAFDRFAYVIAGAYLMNPRVRRLLGMPPGPPKPKPAYPDESDYYLEGGILDPVVERGPIYRPTPPPD
jgi:hypothetical protein